MPRHGVYVTEQATSLSTPAVAAVGIPFVIGTAPVHSAETPVPAGTPVLCTSMAEAVKYLGYSEQWADYTLCEFMYSHFTLYGCQPVILCNMLDSATIKKAVAAADYDIVDHAVRLPAGAINDASLVVSAADGGTALEPEVDYTAFRCGEYLIVETLPDGAAYSAATLNIAYNTVDPGAVTANIIASGLENIEKCMALGAVPDLICAPGFSHDSTVAAVMATKAEGINGLFRAKAIIDIDASGAVTCTDAIAAKADITAVDPNQILCWPMLTLGGRVFHMSTQLAGLMASVDTANGGVPYESPSNKAFKADGLAISGGVPVSMTKAQADMLGAGGIVTGLSFIGGLSAWGNYTACYPVNTDVKDYFIPLSRMFDFTGNTLVRTFWSKVDKPMNGRLANSIVDSVNIWLSGLVGAGYLLGARAEYSGAENTELDLMAGIIRLHIYMAPPSPMQEADFILEYDAGYIAAVFGG